MTAPTTPNLEAMTKAQLLEVAGELGLTGLSSSNKAAIVAAIEAVK